MENKVLYSFCVLGNPTTKKNSQRIITTKKGKCIPLPSKKYSEYEDIFKFYAMKAKLVGLNLNGEYNIRCLYYRDTLRRVDINNLLEATDDCLCAANVIEDDNCSIVCSHDGSRVYLDRKNPRVEIYIEEFNDNNDFIKNKKKSEKR